MGPLMENFYWVVVMRFLSGLWFGRRLPPSRTCTFPSWWGPSSAASPCLLQFHPRALLCAAVFLRRLGRATFPLEVAWKLPFLVGGLPIVMLYFIHKYMPESPRWLMRQNRHDEAEALVERLESSLGMEHDKNYMDPAILAAVNEARSGNKPKVSWTMLFNPRT